MTTTGASGARHESAPVWYDVEVEVTATQKVTVPVHVHSLDEATEQSARAYVENQYAQDVSAWLQRQDPTWQVRETRVLSAKPQTDPR